MRSFRAVVLPLAGAVVLLGQSGTGGQTVPFTFSVSATFSYPLPSSGPIEPPAGYVTTLTGSSTPFGPCQAVEVQGNSDQAPSPTYPFQMTFADGTLTLTLNQAGATVVSSSSSGETLSMQASVTGGTGIFTGASGSAVVTFVGTNTTNVGAGTETQSNAFMATGTLVLTGGGGVTVLPPSLQLQTPLGSTTSATIGLNNQGGSTVSYSASPGAGASWLSVGSASGTLVPGGTAAFQVSANAAGLALGFYQGQVNLTLGNGSASVSVGLLVGPQGPRLQLSQTGLTFDADALGPSPAAQTFGVFNTGVGNLNGLTVSTSVMGSGPNWLSATLGSGFASAASTTLDVSVNPGTLIPGTYYGQITLSLPNALNSPQTVSVQMVVATAYPTFQPAAVLIPLPSDSNSGAPILPLPGPVSVVITNPTPAPLSFTVGVDTTHCSPVAGCGPPLFTPSNTSGTIPQGGTATLTFTLSSSCFGAVAVGCNGSYWVVSFPAINYTYYLFIVLDVTENGSTAPPIPIWGPPPQGLNFPTGGLPALHSTGVHPLEITKATAAATCTPAVLDGLLTSEQLSGFSATVGQPVPLALTIFDNCGSNLNSGSVWASFADNDTPVPLIPIGGGQWSATWVPSVASSKTTMMLQGVSTTGLYGSGAVPVTVAASTTTPIVTPGGVANAASNAPVIAPGAFIAIYGENFPAGTAVENTSTYPTSLASTQVFLGGEALPLYFVAGKQIDALVPFDVKANSTQALVVQSGDALSTPVQVVVGEASPGVFTQDQSGSGPGAILSYPVGGTPALNTPSNPASTGYVLEIYCTGLGPVSPAVSAGTPASSTTLSKTANTVTATVGGQNAQVLFAGLAPGYVGLYQVDLIVPPGITPSNSVPVVLNVAGASSAPVTVAMK